MEWKDMDEMLSLLGRETFWRLIVVFSESYLVIRTEADNRESKEKGRIDYEQGGFTVERH